MAIPSKVEVPLPSSSMITKDEGVAWSTILLVYSS